MKGKAKPMFDAPQNCNLDFFLLKQEVLPSSC
jgi:hypothetical protein